MITVLGDGFTVYVTEPLPDELTVDDLEAARVQLHPIYWSGQLAATLYAIKGVRYEVTDNPLLWEYEGDPLPPGARKIIANTLTIRRAQES